MRRASFIAGVAGMFLAFGAGHASATAFCVPNLAACPNGAGTAQADLETAMSTSSSDGAADTVYVGPVTLATDTNGIRATGSDPLLIQGAGPSATTLSGASTGGNYVLNLITGNTRSVTVRDLKIAIPASEPPDGGAAAQVSGDTFDNVDVVSRNPGASGSQGIYFQGGGAFRNGYIGEESSGALNRSVTVISGAPTIEDTTIQGVTNGLLLDVSSAAIVARRVAIIDPGQVGFGVAAGTMTVENSIVRAATPGFPVLASVNTSSNATVVADHLTAVYTGSLPVVAVSSRVLGSSSGNATAIVSNSILRGYGSGYERQVAGGASGSANLTIRDSNAKASGSSIGAGTLDVATGNIEADPLFTGPTDFRLLPGSPSIDAGDPGTAGLATDFLGAARPVDGDGDGSAVRDQGAYEYQPPDTLAPETVIVSGPGKKRLLRKRRAKFAFGSEAGTTFECSLDSKPFEACSSPLTLKRLKRRKHTFEVRATDASGNVDATPAEKRFRVPKKKRKRKRQ